MGCLGLEIGDEKMKSPCESRIDAMYARSLVCFLCQVGTRYKLERVLGYGSFSCVCLALDVVTGKKVGGVGLRWKIQGGLRWAWLHPGARALREKTYGQSCTSPRSAPNAQVALKRIGDVLQSPDQAKRVLREISILRRLHHPNSIAVYDCFLKPAATGA